MQNEFKFKRNPLNNECNATANAYESECQVFGNNALWLRFYILGQS